MKQVLCVCYYFPPAGGGAVIRWSKFTKYLPLYGWEPLVVTAATETIFTDDSLNTDLHVDRLPLSFLDRWKFRAIKESAADANHAAKKNIDYYKFLGRISRVLEQNLLIPDQHIFWRRIAMKRIRELMKTQPVDAVVTTGPPHSTHLIGLQIKKEFNKPWLVDFRDDWTSNPLFSPSWPTAKWRAERQEKRVLQNADRVVTVTEASRQEFLRTHRTIPENKFVTITNGYDASDFADYAGPPHSGFILSYFGSIGGRRSAQPLFTALQELSIQDKNFNSDLQLEFIGTFTDSREPWRQAWPGRVSFVPPVSHQESIRRMRRAPLLVLMLHAEENSATAVPGKVYEYVASRRPILPIIAPGATRSTLQSVGLTEFADPKDTSAIKGLVLKMYRQWQRRALQPLPGTAIDRYNRQELTARMAELLHTMT